MNKFKLFVLFSVFCLAIAMPLSYADDNETVVAADGQTENPIQQDGDILTSVSYYFDANAENDTGNGSIENPFKDLNADNIKDGSTLYLARGEYNLNKYCSVSNLTIIGSSASDTIVKYNRYQIALKSSSSLTLRNITLIDFKIECSGSLVAKNCIFKDNYASTLYQGSAINVKNKNACVNLNNCTFSNNYAQKGGAIHIEGGNLTVNNSTFTANHASNGGAIYISNGVLKIANSIFSYNYAGLCAGSIFCENDANVFINKTKFSNGYSINDVAGAIYLIDSSLTADALNIENCSSNFGGAMVCLKSTTTLNNFTAVNNSAAYDGGAVFAMYHEFSISNSTLTGNSAARGGALYVSAVDIFMISSNTFTNNTDDAIYSLGSDTYYDSILDEELNNTFIGNDVFEMEIPELFIGNGNYSLLKFNSSYDGKLPVRYNLNDYGYVTPVKNQQNGGNCWAFAAIGALESCLLKATGVSYDLSEENMKNLMSLYSDYGWAMSPNDGGYDKMAIGYLTSWLGPVNESDDIYTDFSVLSPIFNSFMHVQNIAFLTRTSYTDNDAIKKAILDYGAVSTSIYWSTSYLKGKSYYNDANTGANHAVIIVGWDDTYSRDNFRNNPEGDGAWIIKNSWGTTSENDGFYYVSYYDIKCAPINKPSATYTFILNDTMNFDRNYQYDIPGLTDYFINSSTTVWYKNKFTSKGNEYLAAVSTYFEKDTNWQISIYVNDNLKLTKTGFSTTSYKTISLGQLIPLNLGDVFEVVFKITVDGDAAVPISEKISLNYELYSSNISYISYDGKSWADLYDLEWAYPDHIYNSQVACIKAFTITDKLNASINLEISDDYNPISVKASVIDSYGNPVTSGAVTFIVGDESFRINVQDGAAILNHVFKNQNNNTVKAVFTANGYNSNSSSITFNAGEVFLSADNLTVYYGQFAYSAILKDKNGNGVSDKQISFTVGDSVYTSLTGSDGTASVSLKLDVGSHYVKIGFKDDSSFDFNRKITVLSTLTLPETAKYTYNSYYNAVLRDGEGKLLTNRKVNLVISSKTYSTTTDANGKLKYNLKLSPGSYKLTIVNPETGESKTQTINVVARLLGNSGVTMYYGAGKSYKVRAYDDNGNIARNVKVTFTFNSKSYSRYTDSNGYAYLKLAGQPKTYTITASYNGFKVSNKVVIKPTIVMSDRTVKKFKVFGYNVKLLSNQGKILKNKKITLKYRGHTYYAKTNAKGIATFKLKSYLILGRFNIVASYGTAKVKKIITVIR